MARDRVDAYNTQSMRNAHHASRRRFPYARYGARICALGGAGGSRAGTARPVVNARDRGAGPAARPAHRRALWGTGPALVASAAAVAGFSRYFLTPTGFAIGDPATGRVHHVHHHRDHRRRAGGARRAPAREAQAGRQEIERLYQELQAAFDRASEAEARAAQRAAEGGAARRADAQPADAADRDQGVGDGADRRREERPTALSTRRTRRAAAGHRRRVRSAEPLHRRAVGRRSARAVAAAAACAPSASTRSCALRPDARRNASRAITGCR